MRKRKSLEERYKENRDLEKSIFQTTRSYYKFISRIKKRVEEMVEEQEYTYFITYTLNDKSLQDTTEKQHIKKIKRTLTGNSHYLINNDYGDISDRLHYHTLASFPYPYDTKISVAKIWRSRKEVKYYG